MISANRDDFTFSIPMFSYLIAFATTPKSKLCISKELERHPWCVPEILIFLLWNHYLNNLISCGHVLNKHTYHWCKFQVVQSNHVVKFWRLTNVNIVEGKSLPTLSCHHCPSPPFSPLLSPCIHTSAWAFRTTVIEVVYLCCCFSLSMFQIPGI